MQEALYYKDLENGIVKCTLCPWFCVLKPGQTGNCKVRVNVGGKLVTNVYNKVAALGTDPIEKKPLYHFYPGKNILSIGEVGCNLHCSFCQNHNISQCFADDFRNFKYVTSEQIVNEALKTFQNIGIAYTYNEPFTFFEFMLETAKLAHLKGLKNVVVSNGYINPEPLKFAFSYIDAFNIDLKAFTNHFYSKYTKGKLEPVLQTLKIIAKSKAHLEITNLVIPELNDDEKQFKAMLKWIAAELGNQVPLHLSRYFPQHELHLLPTPVRKLESFYEIAKTYLQHVYLGNVNDEKRSSSYCHSCGKILVKRDRVQTKTLNIDSNGNCKMCGAPTNFFL